MQGLPPDFHPEFARLAAECGVQGRSEPIPECLDLRWFKVKCAEMEKILRDQFMDVENRGSEKDRKLPPAWEHELSRYPPTNVPNALERYKYLGHLYRVRNEGLTRKAKVSDPDIQLVAYQLLTREPVEVDIGTRVVPVTDRSMAALIEIARHDARARMLGQDIESVRESKTAIMLELADAEYDLRGRRLRSERRRLHKKVAWFLELETRALFELNAHRQAMYAHVFTDDGRPAESRHQAPPWWVEITPEADMRIMHAVNEAGSGRYRGLGPQPEPPPSDDKHGRWRRLEDFGWLTVVTRWGIEVPIVPASYFDKPLGQAATMFRVGADKVYEKTGHG